MSASFEINFSGSRSPEKAKVLNKFHLLNWEISDCLDKKLETYNIIFIN